MKIVIAQGNPGRRYNDTRHNIGFMVIDTFAKKHKVKWRTNKRLGATVAELILKDEKIMLVKPLTFYNETGRVARALVDFYKLKPADDVLVVHDDLALPVGTIRVREQGSDAGNNGLKSLNSNIGVKYWRIRVGVWNKQRDKVSGSVFVLSRFSKEESIELKNTVIPQCLELIDDFCAGDIIPRSYNL